MRCKHNHYVATSPFHHFSANESIWCNSVTKSIHGTLLRVAILLDWYQPSPPVSMQATRILCGTKHTNSCTYIALVQWQSRRRSIRAMLPQTPKRGGPTCLLPPPPPTANTTRVFLRQRGLFGAEEQKKHLFKLSHDNILFEPSQAQTEILVCTPFRFLWP